jgi:hypothetical protein
MWGWLRYQGGVSVWVEATAGFGSRGGREERAEEKEQRAKGREQEGRVLVIF